MKSRTLHRLGLAAALALLAGCASTSAPVVAETPGCLSNVAVDRLLADYNARRPAANPPETLTMADAHCSRSKLQQRLAGQAGRLVGYKAGLTNPAVQKRFNTDQPVWGALYSAMILNSGVTLDAGFGSRPLYEADLLVRVKDKAINDAATPAQVLAQALKAQGLALRPGQVVSLGSFSALLPPKAGLKVTVHYDGVPGLQPATVSFK